MHESPAIVFENVSLSLGGISILESITATVPSGSSTAIIGPNGAGKTTLLLALLRQIPFEGSIRFPLSGLVPKIGYVPQKLNFDRGMPLTVLEFLVMGRQRLPLWIRLKKANVNEAIGLLSAVNAEHLKNRPLGALSGGEFQRVMLSLAIGQNPEILILDEPSAGMDINGEEMYCELLTNLRKKIGFTQLMVTHDLSMVTAHADHVICLNHKVIGEGAPNKILTSQVLLSTFGLHKGLVDSRAMPDGEPTCSSPCCQEKHP